MKRKYIKPESDSIVCELAGMLAKSTPSTEWHTGEDQQPGTGTTVPPTQPDPNEDAKTSSGLWDDVDDDEM